MKNSRCQNPTLRDYISNYNQLRRAKSLGTIPAQQSVPEKNIFEVQRIVTEKLCRIQNILTQKSEFSKIDSEIMSCVGEVLEYIEKIFLKLKETQNQQNQENTKKAYIQHTKSIKSIKPPSKQIKLEQSKRLMSPIQLNKHFDELTMTASQFGTRLSINVCDENFKQVERLQITNNNIKSLRRMQIGTSIQVLEKSDNQYIIEQVEEEGNSPLPRLPRLYKKNTMN